jgi:hypothetical protein
MSPHGSIGETFSLLNEQCSVALHDVKFNAISTDAASQPRRERPLVGESGGVRSLKFKDVVERRE